MVGIDGTRHVRAVSVIQSTTIKLPLVLNVCGRAMRPVRRWIVWASLYIKGWLLEVSFVSNINLRETAKSHECSNQQFDGGCGWLTLPWETTFLGYAKIIFLFLSIHILSTFTHQVFYLHLWRWIRNGAPARDFSPQDIQGYNYLQYQASRLPLLSTWTWSRTSLELLHIMTWPTNKC